MPSAKWASAQSPSIATLGRLFGINVLESRGSILLLIFNLFRPLSGIDCDGEMEAKNYDMASYLFFRIQIPNMKAILVHALYMCTEGITAVMVRDSAVKYTSA